MGKERVRIGSLVMRQFGEQMVKFSEELSDMATKAMRVGERLVEMSEKIKDGGDDGDGSKREQGKQVNVPGECGNIAEVSKGTRDRELGGDGGPTEGGL